MKQNFTCHLKTTILAIIFLLSGGIPANSQGLLYLVDKNYNYGFFNDNKTDVSELQPPFNLIYVDELGQQSCVTGGEYTLSKQPTTINIENRVEYYDIPENALKLYIDENESSRILCWNLDIENNKVTIAVHDMSLTEHVPATCTSDGYKKYKCATCNEESTESFNALGHSFGEWQETTDGHMRTCSHDASHIQYNMDATGVNSLEITLTDGAKLTYPHTLNPVVTFNDIDVAINFDTDKTSLVNKADITAYNQVWSHNKNIYAQNEDKTYSHACDVADCTFKYNDLFVKNAGQYYVADNKDGVIKVADMTLNDSEGYDCEADITVGSVSYSRDMATYQWGTLCLPFAINPSAYAEYCSFYQLSGVDNEKQEIVLSRIDNQEIAAGTPVLVRRNTAVNGISISATAAAMANSIQSGSTAGDFTIVGTLKTSDALANNAYIINNDKFWNVGDLINNGKATTVKVGAFHSYLVASTPSAQARMLSLSIGDDDTTAIDVLNAADNSEAEIYDLNGHRLPDLQKGINIVKRGNKTTKVIIK